VYNSRVGAWSSIKQSVSDLFFGYRYSQNIETLGWPFVAVVLDCQRGGYLKLNDDPWKTREGQHPWTVRKLDLVKDHLFGLEIKMDVEVNLTYAALQFGSLVNRRCYCTVKEFRARYRDEVGNRGWVKEKKH